MGIRRSPSRRQGAEADAVSEVSAGDDMRRAWFTEERIAIAARGVGAMWRLLDETVSWTTGREQGGARIYDHQGVSFPLADSAADAAAGRLLALTVAKMADDGADRKVVHHKASMAKLFSSEAAGAAPIAACRPSVAAGTCARTSPSGCCASCVWTDLGGHLRDPAADRRPRPGAPRASSGCST